jgi:hypothetical protein
LDGFAIFAREYGLFLLRAAFAHMMKVRAIAASSSAVMVIVSAAVRPYYWKDGRMAQTMYHFAVTSWKRFAFGRHV